MTRFVNYPFKTSPGVSSLTAPDRWGDVITTDNYGPIADGGSHPLGDRYSSLMQARGDYPFVTSLDQEIDWAACQLASNIAFGAAGSEHGNNVELNRNIQIDNGIYFFGNDTWVIRNLASSRIIGDGQFASQLTGNSIVLQFDGIWYSVLESFSVISLLGSSVAALDMDGNVPGHPYTTRGVQGVDLVNMSIIAQGGGTYAFALCRLGSSDAQGSECQYRDLHLSGASESCYYQNGFNNVSNMFLGGDIQNYPKNGIESTSGTIHVIGTSFESTKGFEQYINDGYDIRVGDAGAFDGCIIHGCRSESMRFLLNAGAQVVDIAGCTGRAGSFSAWAAGHAYIINDAVRVSASKQIFKVTVAGTSGGTEPIWPVTGTIVDGGVTWEFVDFNYIENNNGFVDLSTCSSLAGRIVYNRFGQGVQTPVSSNYTVKDADNIIFVDATSAPVTVTIPTPSNLDRTRTITIKKIDTSANAVTVAVADSSSIGAQFEGGGATDSIAGGSRGFKTYSFNNEPGGTSPPWWYIIGSG